MSGGQPEICRAATVVPLGSHPGPLYSLNAMEGRELLILSGEEAIDLMQQLADQLGYDLRKKD